MSLIYLAYLFLLIDGQTSLNASEYRKALMQACSVYCWGDILRTIQLSGIYNDSKTFVDMPMKFDPGTVQYAFDNITDRSNTSQLVSFLSENFDEVGSDVYSYTPVDIQSHPEFLQRIENLDYQEWASDINQLWLSLGKQVNESVLTNPQRHSFVQIKYPMIVPGGRFRESYYWDSWWILKGLLVCDMPYSAMNIINILLDEVTNYGFVPNGARIYYLDRSQPPVLSNMIVDMCQYYGMESANATALLTYAYPILEQEYAWWMNPANKHISSGIESNGSEFTLNKYHSNGTTPRPESYVEDSANGNSSEYWRNVRTGAETGWDFSSRYIGGSHDSAKDILATGTVLILKYTHECVLCTNNIIMQSV